jgi:MFS family permease
VPTISPSPSSETSGIVNTLENGISFLIQPFMLMLYIFAVFLFYNWKGKRLELQLGSKLRVKNSGLFGFSVYLLVLGCVTALLFQYQLMGLGLTLLGVFFITISFYYLPKTETSKTNFFAIFAGALLLAGLMISFNTSYYWQYSYQGFGIVLFIAGIFLSAVAFLIPAGQNKVAVKKVRKCPMCDYIAKDKNAEHCSHCGETLPKVELKGIKTTKFRFIGSVLVLAGILAFLVNISSYLELWVIPLIFLMFFVLNTSAFQRKHLWTMIACEIAVLVELFIVWQVVGRFLYYSETNNWGTAYGYYLNNLILTLIPFALTIGGTIMMAFVKEEFKD